MEVDLRDNEVGDVEQGSHPLERQIGHNGPIDELDTVHFERHHPSVPVLGKELIGQHDARQ